MADENTSLRGDRPIQSKYRSMFAALSQEENAMGRLLKTRSQQDKTRAGKMMAAVGKAQSFSSQQRWVSDGLNQYREGLEQHGPKAVWAQDSVGPKQCGP